MSKELSSAAFKEKMRKLKAIEPPPPPAPRVKPTESTMRARRVSISKKVIDKALKVPIPNTGEFVFHWTLMGFMRGWEVKNCHAHGRSVKSYGWNKDETELIVELC